MIGALDTSTSGTVRLEGADLGTLSRQALSRLRRDRIDFVFQAYNLILSAYENAEIVMAVQSVAEAERRERVMKRASTTAGPAVVLADEPTAQHRLRDGRSAARHAWRR